MPKYLYDKDLFPNMEIRVIWMGNFIKGDYNNAFQRVRKNDLILFHLSSGRSISEGGVESQIWKEWIICGVTMRAVVIMGFKRRVRLKY